MKRLRNWFILLLGRWGFGKYKWYRKLHGGQWTQTQTIRSCLEEQKQEEIIGFDSGLNCVYDVEKWPMRSWTPEKR